MDARRRIDAVMKYKELEDDERAVLRRLLQAGYAQNGTSLGRVAALTADELANEVTGVDYCGADPDKYHESAKRRLRSVINHLIIRHGIPIMCEAGKGGGYYLPGDESEVEQNHARFHRRAMTGLMKASRARKSAYADAVIQLAMGYDAPEGHEIRQRLGAPISRAASPPAWVQVVTRLLDHLKGNPEAYATQIAHIQERYGDIFVPRHKVRELRELSGRLQRVLGGLA